MIEELSVSEIIAHCPFFATVIKDSDYFNSANRMAECFIAIEMKKPFLVFIRADMQLPKDCKFFEGAKDIKIIPFRYDEECMEYIKPLVLDWGAEMYGLEQGKWNCRCGAKFTTKTDLKTHLAKTVNKHIEIVKDYLHGF